jgi:ferric-dicitrate binding protein FerR (iron transport regulator)
MAAAALLVVSIAGLLSTGTGLFVDPVSAGTVELVRGSLSVEGIAAPASAGERVTTATAIATDASSLASIRTNGGASVRLDRSTSIEFETPDRIRLIAGAVYVDSPEEARGELEIIAPDAVVREIGTQFETRLTSEGTIVRVREGRVIVSASDEEVEADAGTELAIAASGAITRRAFDPWDPEWGWTLGAAPAFSIEGRTLQDFLGWASRESGFEVDISAVDHAILGSRLHGSIEGLTPLEAIDAVLVTTGLEGRTAEGHLVVRHSSGE